MAMRGMAVHNNHNRMFIELSGLNNLYAPQRGKHLVAVLSVRPELVWNITSKLLLAFK